jgi:ParB family chromosome partitioning protein
MAGLDEIPAIIKDVGDQAAAIMALIENMQRENLNPLEEAQGLQRLIMDFSFTHEEVANSIGRSRSSVSNLLRLLNLARPVQTMLMAGDIDMGHARALLAADGATQIRLATQVVGKKLSVRETEKLVARELSERTPLERKNNKVKSADVQNLEEELSNSLSTRVTFKFNAKGRGQIRIDFADLDVLDGILQKIRPLQAG